MKAELFIKHVNTLANAMLKVGGYSEIGEYFNTEQWMHHWNNVGVYVEADRVKEIRDNAELDLQPLFKNAVSETPDKLTNEILLDNGLTITVDFIYAYGCLRFYYYAKFNDCMIAWREYDCIAEKDCIELKYAKRSAALIPDSLPEEEKDYLVRHFLNRNVCQPKELPETGYAVVEYTNDQYKHPRIEDQLVDSITVNIDYGCLQAREDFDPHSSLILEVTLTKN